MKKIQSLYVVTAALCASLTYAQSPHWQQMNGPGGADISALASDSTGILFAGSANGIKDGRIYRSRDGGSTWENILKLNRCGPIHSLHVSNNATVVAVAEQGTLVSHDHGDSWTATGRQFEGLAWARGSFVGYHFDSIWISRDDATTWTYIPAANILQDPVDLHATKDGLLLLNTYSAFYRSLDGGLTWLKIVNGLNHTGAAFSLSTDAAGADHLVFAGSSGTSYISIDSGRTWTYTPTSTALWYGTSGTTYAVTQTSGDFAPWNTSAPVYTVSPDDRFYLAMDAGTLGRQDKLGNLDYLVVPTGSPFLLQAFGDSLMASSIFEFPFQQDQSYYEPSGWGISLLDQKWSPNSQFSAYSAASDSNGHDYEILASGFIVDRLESWRWQPVSSTLSSMCISNRGSVLASSTSEGVFRSTDHGMTWDQTNTGLTDLHVHSITSTTYGSIIVSTPAGIFRSTDDASSWIPLASTPSKDSAVLMFDPRGKVILAYHDSGIFLSSNNGDTWDRTGTGALQGGVNCLLVTITGSTLAGTDSGLFLLRLGGNAWERAPEGLQSQRVLSLTQDRNGFVYAGVDGSGVFKSIEAYNFVARTSLSASHLKIDALYPNPISQHGSLTFSVPQASDIRIEITSTLGETVREIAAGHFEKGQYDATLTTTGLVNGAYLVRLTSTMGTATQTLVVAN